MQKNVGSLLALYPTPATIVGATVEGKVNWLLVAHVGIIGHDRIIISLAKPHFTNQGIKTTGKVSVALIDEEMLPKADYVGSSSGAKTDKSEVFAWHEGEYGAPIIDEAPLVLECEVVDNYETETFDNFILKINATYVEESKLNEDGKPDYEKIAPVLFEFPTYSYVASGKIIGKCLSFKEQKKKRPKIAMGAWAWGNDGTFGDHYEASDLKDVYEAAMKHGLNLWDTAFVYGMGTSEKILGELTEGTPAEDLILSTKFTPQCDDGSEEPMLHMLEDSLKNLHAGVIDVWWIHNPMDVERYTPMLIPLAQKGLIKEIGVSNHSLAEIKRANEILSEAGLKISAVQNHFSLLNRSSEDSGILEYCKENEITFYAYMVLEQGALSGKYDTAHPFPEASDRGNTYNPMMAEIEKLTEVLKEIGDAHGISVAQAVTAWAVQKGTLPIVGVTKIHHVEDAFKAASVVLSREEISRMEKTADELGLSTIRFWEKKME